MFNTELNSRAEAEFRSYIEGKRVVVVGNAASMISGEGFGEEIDSFDIVVRMGKGVPYDSLSKYLGTRTDVWTFGVPRAGMYRYFGDTPWRWFTPSQMNAYEETKNEMIIPSIMMNGTLQVYRDFFMMSTIPEIRHLNKLVNGNDATARLSQGVQVIDWLQRKMGHRDITLIGFDFFGTEFKYVYGSPTASIREIHPVSSWHCPLVSKIYENNPHDRWRPGATMNNEQTYVASLDGIEIRKMPSVDLEKMDEILGLLRPGSRVLK